ncbi:secreted and transmembrane protein 1A isoform X1 [Nannospalax galili]|uniref:secreted and transmembrane protein 1A isoform X1 n=1 Tax=Nannospalax galili TaxID=1026970 RepID=UPI0004ED1BBE|nr:secreted and transmembrane protein 1A isoform X1 [Nannospalax galili]
MVTCPLASTSSIYSLLGVFLLLDASLSSCQERWDDPICTESVVSVFRGSHAVMSCNISNNFSDITISLASHGERVRTIFNETPPGNASEDGWQLQIHGGQAQLVINNVQDIHTGQYQWRLHGCQAEIMNIFLNISESQDQEEAIGQRRSMSSSSQDSLPTAEKLESSPSSGRKETITIVVIVTIIIIILILGITHAWHKHHHMQKFQQIRASVPDLRDESEPPSGAYLPLP